MRHGSEPAQEPIRAMRLLRRGLAASPELRRGAALTLLLALVAAGGRVITPVLVQQLVDDHLGGGPVDLAGLLTLAGTGVVLVLVAAWAARTTNQRLATASERALCGLRVRAFNHIHALSMAHHTEEQRGALVSRVTSDVETLGQFFRWGGLAWIINSALMLAALAAMVVYDWRLALVAVATVLPWRPCSGSCSAGWWWPGTRSAPGSGSPWPPSPSRSRGRR
jgi:ATP-binding cassette, subfamily B, bacterial